MIITKIIIIYFIQIRHTDDFPTTGTRLVYIMNDHYSHYCGNYINYVSNILKCMSQTEC